MKKRIITFLLIVLGLFIVSDYTIPENRGLFSGKSVVESEERIDNEHNVLNYSYITAKVSEKNICLKDIPFHFIDEIILYGDMYPQGICFMEDYLLISSYSTQSNALGIVSIYDKDTKEYMISLALDSKSHLGGITYDGSNVWVCNSSKMSIERISCDFIYEAIENYPGQVVDVRNVIDEYVVKIRPSSICYFDNKLWIGAHSLLAESKMITYTYDSKNDVLDYKKAYSIPAKVQGIAFDEDGRIILSTSYGRKRSSYLKIYDSVDVMSENVYVYAKSIEMPPCSEGIVLENNQLYIIFESAAKKYLEGTDGKGKSVSPLDKILIIDPS